MKEIDALLIELRRLLIRVKVWGSTYELQGKINGLFARVNQIIKEIDDLDEMERVRKNAVEVAYLASSLLLEQNLEVMEFLQLLSIPLRETS